MNHRCNPDAQAGEIGDMLARLSEPSCRENILQLDLSSMPTEAPPMVVLVGKNRLFRWAYPFLLFTKAKYTIHEINPFEIVPSFSNTFHPFVGLPRCFNEAPGPAE